MSTEWLVAGESPHARNEMVTSGSFEPRWYAVSTRSRHEKTVGDLLQRKQIEMFLPLYETTRRWKNGEHRVRLPLFPSYAFVHILLRDRLQVLQVPGVVRFVSFNSTPVPLHDSEVENIRRVLVTGVNALPHPYLKVGRRVRIAAGPLAGCEGILRRRKNDLRAVLSIHLIQRSIMVDVDAGWLQPAG